MLGLHLAAGSLPSYLISFATISSAFVLPVVGAFVDRSAPQEVAHGGLCLGGVVFAALLFFLQGESWQLGAVAVVAEQHPRRLLAGRYYAILVDISTEDERDQASSRGWAWGYLGGGLLLLVNLAVYSMHDTFGLAEGMSVRLSLLSAALWWAGFTIIPLVRLRDYAPQNVVAEKGTVFQRSFGQLFTTLREMRATR